VIGPEAKQAMRDALAHIQDGGYARDFILGTRRVRRR